MLSDALVFFLLSLGAGGGGGGGGRFFFQAVFGVESKLSSDHFDSGFFMKVLFWWGEGGEDLFSFQAMGRPKVPCFYSF
jgi:hypothetical protein